jgi:AcrR family transcriptional regulator
MSPRSKEQYEQIKDERREQILYAALRVFSRRGLAATKIGDVAEAAGLSHGLVYHYFESKDAIFVELVRRAVRGAAVSLSEIEQLPLEPLDKIRAISSSVLAGIESSADSAYYFFLMMQAYVSDANPAEVKELMRGSNEPSEILLRIVREGQARGQIREGDPAGYVLAFWATVQGLAVYRVSMGESLKMPDSGLLVRMFEC